MENINEVIECDQQVELYESGERKALKSIEVMVRNVDGVKNTIGHKPQIITLAILLGFFVFLLLLRLFVKVFGKMYKKGLRI